MKLGGNIYNRVLDQIPVLYYLGRLLRTPAVIVSGIFTDTVRKFQIDNDFARGIAIASMDQ
jgi:hypothetical protein